MKKIIMSIAAAFFLSVSFYAHAQPIPGEAKTIIIKGAVVDVDWVAGKLAVRTNNFDSPDEITVIVTQDTRIIKGVEAIFFSDVIQGDQVTVSCAPGSLAGIKALQIVVNE